MNLLCGLFLTITVLLLGIFATSVSAQGPPTNADCVDEKPFPDPLNCTNYYQCFDLDGEWVLLHLDCPPGGYWDNENSVCILGTCENPTTIPPSTTTEIAESTTVTAEASETTTASSSGSTAGSSTALYTEISTTKLSSSSTSITTEESSTTELSTGAPTSRPPTFVCTVSGFFANPTDPTKYYQCVLIGAQFYYYAFNCPPLSCFQQSQRLCVVGSCAPANSTTTTVTTPTTTTQGGQTQPSTTTPGPVEIICNTPGKYAYPGSCTKYYNCLLLQGSFVYYVFECPPNSYFDVGKGLCIVGQCPATTTTAATTTSITTSTTITRPTTTTPSTTTTTTLGTTTTAAPKYPCLTQGYFADPVDCQAYYRCVTIQDQMYRYMFRCPATAYWDTSRNGCIIGSCPR